MTPKNTTGFSPAGILYPGGHCENRAKTMTGLGEFLDEEGIWNGKLRPVAVLASKNENAEAGAASVLGHELFCHRN